MGRGGKSKGSDWEADTTNPGSEAQRGEVTGQRSRVCSTRLRRHAWIGVARGPDGSSCGAGVVTV